MLAYFIAFYTGQTIGITYDFQNLKNLPINPYPGEPALPVDIRRLYLPPHARNVRLIVDELITGERVDINLDFNDTIRILKEEGDSIIPLPRINHPAPILLEGYGRGRDRTVAVVRINPLYFDGREIRMIKRVSFHLEWDESTNSVEPLPDSLDYLILTLSRFHPHVDSIAFLAQLRGLRTLVVDIDSIAHDPVAVRNLIKYYYRNFGIRYAAIVGHGSLISPFLLRFHPDSVLTWVYPTGPLVYTDFPYMALDGKYFSSRDEFVGDGDDGTDMVPDIGFSRIPVTNSWELGEYYRKLKKSVFGTMDNSTGSLTCLESRLDMDSTSFMGMCDGAINGIDIPRVQRMYEPLFDYNLEPQEFFDSLNALKPQIFIYLGHSNIDRILTTYYPRKDIFTYKYYLHMDDYFVPFAYIGGCWPGDIMSSSMAQNLSKMEIKGALFAFGASKLDYASNETMKARSVLEGFFILKYPFASDVMNYIRDMYVNRRYFMYEIQSFGDPTATVFTGPVSTPPATYNTQGSSITLNAPDSTFLSVFTKDGSHFRYFLPRGDTTIHLSLFHPETLLISIWKPGYTVDTFQFVYTPDDVVAGKPFIDAQELAFGNEYVLSVPVANYSTSVQSAHIHIEGYGFAPSPLDTTMDLNPSESVLLEFPIEPDNSETFSLYMYLNGQMVGSYRFRVENARFYIAGVKWTADSVYLDIHNGSPFALQNVNLNSWYGRATFHIPAGSSTYYTTGIPVPSNVDTVNISINWNGYSTAHKLVRNTVEQTVKDVQFRSRMGGLELYIRSNSLPQRYKVYFKPANSIGNYRFAGLTDSASAIFYFSTPDYREYCFRVSILDRWYNEGPLSEEYCSYPSPVHGEMLPISMEGWFFSQPVVGQFDSSTPQKEIFAITNVHYGFFDSHGEPYPGYPVRLMLEVRAKPVVLDMDDDGREEVVVSGKSLLDNRAYIMAFHIDGRIDTLYSSEHPYDFALYGGLLAQDFLGDDKPEILLKNYYGSEQYAPRIMIFSGDSMVLQWMLNGDILNYIVPSAGDVDGDGKAEVVFVDEDGFLYALNADSTSVPGFPVDLTSHFSGTVRFSQIIGLDSVMIAIIYTYQNSAYAIQVDFNGNVLSSSLLASGNVMYEWKHAALGYLNHDSVPDIVLSTRDSLIVADVYGNRLSESRYEYILGPYTMSSPVVGDVGLDGNPDVIYTNASMLNVMSLDNGHLMEYPGFPLILADDSTMDHRGLFPPFLHDIDGDGYGEIYIAASRLSYIYQIRNPVVGEVIWSEEFANKWNTGWYGFQPPEPIVSSGEISGRENIQIHFDPRTSSLILRASPDSPEMISLKIYDIGGRLRKTYRKRVSGRSIIRINLGELPSGVYVVDGETGDHWIKFSFVKVR